MNATRMNPAMLLMQYHATNKMDATWLRHMLVSTHSRKSLPVLRYRATGPQTRGSVRKRSAEACTADAADRLGFPPNERGAGDVPFQVMAKKWAIAFLADDRFQTLQDCDVLAEADLSAEFPVRQGQASTRKIYGYWAVQHDRYDTKYCEAYVEDTHWSHWKNAGSVRSLLDSSLRLTPGQAAVGSSGLVMRTSMWKLFVAALTLPRDVLGPLQRRFLAMVAISLRDGHVDKDGVNIWLDIQLADSEWRQKQGGGDLSRLPDFSFLDRSPLHS